MGEFSAVPFIDWDEADIYIGPELPKIKWRKDGWIYQATDLRYLKDFPVLIFSQILGEAIKNRALKEVEYAVPDETTTDEFRAVVDIVSGIGYSAKKSRKGSVDGTLICTGAEMITHREGYTKTVKFHLIPDGVKAVHDFAEERGCPGGKIDYLRLIEHVAQRVFKEISKHMEKQGGAEDG